MSLSIASFPAPFGRRFRRASAAPALDLDSRTQEGACAPAREPEHDLRSGRDAVEAHWRASSYELRRGLDVVELPNSLPVEVLDRLFNAPGR